MGRVDNGQERELWKEGGGVEFGSKTAWQLATANERLKQQTSHSFDDAHLARVVLVRFAGCEQQQQQLTDAEQQKCESCKLHRVAVQ